MVLPKKMTLYKKIYDWKNFYHFSWVFNGKVDGIAFWCLAKILWKRSVTSFFNEKLVWPFYFPFIHTHLFPAAQRKRTIFGLFGASLASRHGHISIVPTSLCSVTKKKSFNSVCSSRRVTAAAPWQCPTLSTAINWPAWLAGATAVL